jgi:hypothetical protein
MNSSALDDTKLEDEQQPERLSKLKDIKYAVRELTDNDIDKKRMKGQSPEWLESMVLNYLLHAEEEPNINPTTDEIRGAINDVLNGKFNLLKIKGTKKSPFFLSPEQKPQQRSSKK